VKRTSIILNKKLIEEGKKITGLKTNKDLVDFALKELLRYPNQRRILEFIGAAKTETLF
jgi:Arc/MetJ family transcription regulator